MVPLALFGRPREGVTVHVDTPLSAFEIASILRAAAVALETENFRSDRCCGLLVNEQGQCQHRPYHPTIAHPNPWSYPEYYRSN